MIHSSYRYNNRLQENGASIFERFDQRRRKIEKIMMKEIFDYNHIHRAAQTFRYKSGTIHLLNKQRKRNLFQIIYCLYDLKYGTISPNSRRVYSLAIAHLHFLFFCHSSEFFFSLSAVYLLEAMMFLRNFQFISFLYE